MRLSNLIIPILFITLFFSSCIEPFQPETSEYEEMILIEGLLTDSPSAPVKISISRTVPISSGISTRSKSVSGAFVSIERDDGVIYPLAETSIGTYTNIGPEIELEEGRYYKLVVLTQENETFESDLELYQLSPPIDSITCKTEVKKVSELDIGDHGLQFYVNSTALDDNPLFLRWIVDATFNYQAPFESDFIWSGQELEPFINNQLINCWKDDYIGGVFIGTSIDLMENRVANAPLNFVSQYGDELTVKYSIKVIQLSISESTYKFWTDLNRIINETGGLYETQPFRIKGNISCVSNPEINALGIFEVAGAAEERVFVTRPHDFNIYPVYCPVDTVGTITYPWGDVPYHAFIMNPIPGVYLTSNKDCFNCTERGGTLERPLFWE